MQLLPPAFVLFLHISPLNATVSQYVNNADTATKMMRSMMSVSCLGCHSVEAMSLCYIMVAVVIEAIAV